MGRARRKKGKNARRSRQGQLGLLKTVSAESSTDKQFEKKVQVRDEKRDKKKDVERAGELVRDQLGRGKENVEKTPFVFVIHTGRVGKYARRLERDVRRIILPNTSMDLRVLKRNNFKDFLVHSQYLGVSHLIAMSRTEKSLNMRIIRNPQGPTLHFKVESYSLCRDIQSAQKRPINFKEMFSNAPLVVMNGFSQSNEKHLSLVQNVIQHMFPSIDVDKVKLKAIRRALLVSYDSENDVIELRHYAIKAVPSGISKSAKKLMKNKVPDLSRYKDFSDFLLNPGALSESEPEIEQVELELPQDVNTRGLTKGQKTKLRLVEIGPRMTWKLMKIEEGINDGEVLYHNFVQKSNQEVDELRKRAPRIRKKKQLCERNVEQSVIRKLKARAEQIERQEAKFNAEKAKLIQRQSEVTGEPVAEDRKGDQREETAASNEDDDDDRPVDQDGDQKRGSRNAGRRPQKFNDESGRKWSPRGAQKTFFKRRGDSRGSSARRATTTGKPMMKRSRKE